MNLHTTISTTIATPVETIGNFNNIFTIILELLLSSMFGFIGTYIVKKFNLVSILCDFLSNRKKKDSINNSDINKIEFNFDGLQYQDIVKISDAITQQISPPLKPPRIIPASNLQILVQ